MAGSLTGVVASKSVTEAFKGTLSTDGNRARSAIAEGCLTARRTGRTGTKVGYSDGEGPKGSAVRRLKWHASWVQNVARQFGPYLLWAWEICQGLFLVREDRDGRAAGAPVVVPTAPLGSQARKGEALKASKCETRLKMRSPRRAVADDDVDRPQV